MQPDRFRNHRVIDNIADLIELDLCVVCFEGGLDVQFAVDHEVAMFAVTVLLVRSIFEEPVFVVLGNAMVPRRC
jgi:hypothetical protein